MSDTINNFTLGANQNLNVSLGQDYTNLVVTPGFNNVSVAGEISVFTIDAVALPVDLTVGATGILNNGVAQDSSVDEVQILNYGGTSLVAVEENAVLRAEKGSTNTDDTISNGGSFFAGSGASVAGADIKSGGIFENGGATISSLTLEAGGSLDLLAGTDTNDLIMANATADQGGGVDEDPNVGGTLIVSNEYSPLLVGAHIQTGGDAEIQSGATASGTIDLSGTLILDTGSIDDAAISFGSSGALMFKGIAGSINSATVDIATDIATFDLNGTFVTQALAGDYTNGSFDISSVMLSGTDSSEITFVEHALCFVEGTRIRTPDGEVAIEELNIGDMVLTASGEAKPIKWIGKRDYNGAFIDGNHSTFPIWPAHPAT